MEQEQKLILILSWSKADDELAKSLIYFRNNIGDLSWSKAGSNFFFFFS
jgi:hypothetical protein